MQLLFFGCKINIQKNFRINKNFFNCFLDIRISHILITFFEGKKKIKLNTIIEIYLLFPFLLTLFYVLIKYENLIFISFILLLKECMLIFFRTNKIKENIYKLHSIYLNIIIVIINLIVNIYYNQYFLYSFILLILFNSFLIVKMRSRK